MSKPVKVIKAGAVRAAIFRNPVTSKDGGIVQLAKVVLEVRYRDKHGEWKGTNSLSLNELPKAILALEQAYAYLLAHPHEDASESSGPASGFPGSK